MTQPTQVKNSLDPVTQLKIYKGMIIALSGAVGVLVLLAMWGLGIDKAALGAFISWILPVGVNAYHQFSKGETPAFNQEQQ